MPCKRVCFLLEELEFKCKDMKYTSACAMDRKDSLKTASLSSKRSISQFPTGLFEMLTQTDHYDSLTSELQCIGCLDFMRPPIRLCAQGHSVCGKCRRRLNSCPKCDEPFTKTRSLVLEAIIGKLQFPCHHKGCTKRYPLDTLDKHISECQHRITDCFMARVYGNCIWSGKAGEWLEHCLNDHSDRVSDLPFLEIKYKWNTKNVEAVQNYYLLRCFDTVFNVYQIYDKKGGKMMWTVLWTGNHKENLFYYEIEIFTPDTTTKKIIYRQPCKSEKDADILSSHQNISLPIEHIFYMLDKDEFLNYKVRVFDASAERKNSVSNLGYEKISLVEEELSSDDKTAREKFLGL